MLQNKKLTMWIKVNIKDWFSEDLAPPGHLGIKPVFYTFKTTTH